MQHDAAVVAGLARQRGAFARAEEADALRESIADTYRKYGGVKDRLDVLLDAVPGLGAVPVIPLALAGVAIAVAAAMYSIFRRADAQEQALSLIGEGVIQPDDLRQLRHLGRGTFGELADVARYAAIGAALVVGVPLVARLLGR
jgi:hypothetical protein